MPSVARRLTTGDVFGLWTVVDDSLHAGARPRRVMCRCVCGIRKLIDHRVLVPTMIGGCADCRREKRAAG